MGFKTWTVAIQVSDTWVEDGFDLTNERMHTIMCEHLSWAYGHEIKCRVLTCPEDADVATLMGYKTVQEYLRQRRA